jgi:hypothetical protein
MDGAPGVCAAQGRWFPWSPKARDQGHPAKSNRRSFDSPFASLRVAPDDHESRWYKISELAAAAPRWQAGELAQGPIYDNFSFASVSKEQAVIVEDCYAARASRLGRKMRMTMYAKSSSAMAPQESSSTSHGVPVRLGR